MDIREAKKQISQKYVTHPHVTGIGLCKTSDGREAIRLYVDDLEDEVVEEVRRAAAPFPLEVVVAQRAKLQGS
jgi:hypothetical protein